MSELRIKGKPKTKTKQPVETVANWSERQRTAQVACCECCLKRELSDSPYSSSKGAREIATTTPIGVNPVVSIDLTTGITTTTTTTTGEKQQQPGVGGEQQDETGRSSVSNVSQVKKNFRTLLSHNKLRDFYLGTLIYSVMNFSSAMFHSALFTRLSAGGRSRSSSFSLSLNETGEEEKDWVSSEQEAEADWRPTTHLLASKLAECLYGRSEVASSSPSSQLAKLAGSLSLLTVLLAITAAVTTLKFRNAAAVLETSTGRRQVTPTAINTATSMTRRPPRSATREKAGQALNTLGLLLILVLLYLPLVMLNLDLPLAREERQTASSASSAATATRATQSELLGADWSSAQPKINSGSRLSTGEQQSGVNISWLSRHCNLPDLTKVTATRTKRRRCATNEDSDHDDHDADHYASEKRNPESRDEHLPFDSDQQTFPETLPFEELPPRATPGRESVPSSRQKLLLTSDNNNNSGNNANHTDFFLDSSSSSPSPSSFYLFQLLYFYSPIGALLALAYLQPHLLEGSRLSGRLIYALTVLPLLAFALARLMLLSAARGYLRRLHSASRAAGELAEAQLTRQASRDFDKRLAMEEQLLFGSGQSGASSQPAEPFLPARPATLASRPPASASFYSLATSAALELELGLSADLALILLLGLPLALAFGSLKRREFVRSLSGRTFAGATRLIEAKVSLEHQRQQQETLLLSVLPAYVAEQVKRNMLKKTTSTSPGSWPAAPLPSAPSGQANQQSHHQHHLHHQATNASEHHEQHSPAASRGSKLVSQQQGHNSSTKLDQIERQQQQSRAPSETAARRREHRRSFQLASKLTLGLASGAALISETLAGRRQRSNSASTKAAGGSSNSQEQQSLTAAVTVAGGSSPNQQHHVATPAHQIPVFSGTPMITSSVQPTAGIVGLASSGQARRGFNELYIRTYNNVSLLYGDIVGFTRLCTQLSSSQLVRVLNDLFSHFDHLAEQHRIMRIKILGDCYYGVGGIPEFAVMGAKSRATRNDNHAINCVNMGLDMIHYIKCLNVERATSNANFGSSSSSNNNNNNNNQQQSQMQQASSATAESCCWAQAGSDLPGAGGTQMGVAGRISAARNFPLASGDQTTTGSGGAGAGSGSGANETADGGFTPLPAFELNMRIGIHTGHIHSGVIGLKKWQFDVWSNDVSIAMHCESSGMAGRVQVTEATIQHLNGAFSYEQAHGAERDSFLANKDICTYFIKDRVHHQKCSGLLEPTSSAAWMSGGQLLSRSTSSLAATTSTPAPPRPATYHQGGKGVLKFLDTSSNSNNLSDEDNIRAATIGTIRQTLLAGDSFASQSFNSHGAGGGGGGTNGGGTLAFNYQDLNPITLSYRDPQMGKLYARRKLNNLMLELSTLVLLLGVLVPLLNYWLLADSGSNFAPIFWVVVILFNLTLLLFQFRPLEGKSTATQVKCDFNSSPMIHSNHHQHQSQSMSVPCSFQGPAQQPHQLIKDGQQTNVSEKMTLSCLQRQFERLRASLAILCLKLSSKWPIINIDSRRTRLKSALTTLVFLTVILVQCCAIYRQFCSSNSTSIKEPIATATTEIGKRQFSNIVTEQYQLNVILLLISVDSSTNLLGYKTKSAIILSLMAVHILSAWLPCLISVRTICGADFSSRLSSSSQSSSQSLSSSALPLAALSSQRASLLSLLSSPTQHYQQQQQQPKESSSPPFYFCRLNEPPRIKDSILGWSNALLFVAAFWSLTFARRLEYTNRVNFLWRNRLNVDHEELEYISGINKVLLENILPSHVVKHYLTQPAPAEQQRTTVRGAANHQQQQLDHRAHGGPEVGGGRAGSELQGYMRMSFSNMRSHNNELYHEQHDSVAVMFASIPHFYEFYDESDISKQGLGCIALLNEIICDFDKLLLKNKFSRIEKIKTIGSTYMAAAGLRPSNLGAGRNSTASQLSANPLQPGQAQHQHHQSSSSPLPLPTGSQTSSQPNELFASSGLASFVGQSSLTIANDNSANVAATSDSPIGAASSHNDRRLMLSQQKLNLICMVQFATSLMSALNGINKQSFQVFKLRVGVNTGSVIAGIIGAQRPFYDIWGDCVNIASRMESLGQVGRIQVEEKTAKLLMESLCADTYSIVKRGPIDVKGKGGMVTYFVDKKPSSSALTADGGNSIKASSTGDDRLSASNGSNLSNSNSNTGIARPNKAQEQQPSAMGTQMLSDNKTEVATVKSQRDDPARANGSDEPNSSTSKTTTTPAAAPRGNSFGIAC